MIPQTPDIMPSPLCNEGDTRNIPEDTPLGTNQLSYKLGFPPITSIDVKAGGIAPSRVDMNAALKLLSIHTYFLQSGNKYKDSNLLDYDKGCTILGSDGALYLCIQANGATSPNTVQNPTNSTGYWVEVIDAQGVFNINIIADGAVSTEKLANSAVTSAKIADGTIVNADIANTTITGAKLVNKTITAKQIADNTITAAQLAANSVGASELADNAVDTNAIANLSVTNAKIANSAVNNAKISDVAASKVTGLATVATSGSYNDLINRPTIPTNFPPKPVKNTGTVLGVWRWGINEGTSYTLPSGGTWAWMVIPASTINHSLTSLFANAGVDSGGTTVVSTAGADLIFCALIWRIQ